MLAENLLRNLDGDSVQVRDLQALIDWQKTGTADHEIAFRPARVLMQDFTGVPAVVDLAAMRRLSACWAEKRVRSIRCRRSIWLSTTR